MTTETKILEPITELGESTKAFSMYKARFVNGARLYSGHSVGYQGGGQSRDVYWQQAVGIWGLFEPRAVKGRYWICFGLENPAKSSSLTISVETNPPLEGVNRRCAGVFLRDEQGNFYIAHSGKVGGGRKGIGKKAFRAYSQSKSWVNVSWPGGKRGELRLICKLDSPETLSGTAEFVNEVAAFKSVAVAGA